MTGLTMLLKDGEDILIKGRGLYEQQNGQNCHKRNVSKNIPLLAEERWRDSLIEAGAPGAKREPDRAKPQ